MRESRTYGSVRGALSNERPYRVPGQRPRAWHRTDLSEAVNVEIHPALPFGTQEV
jgi:hypothetical protein